MYTVPESTAYGHIVTVSEEVIVASASVGSTEDAVRSYFKDIPVMIQIARCESGFRHILADGSVLRGVVDNADTGVMQINKRYHLSAATIMGFDLDNIQGNMAYARTLYLSQGTQPWNASSPCWGQTLALNI